MAFLIFCTSPYLAPSMRIELALQMGLKTLKMFPGSVIGGINWLKAMNGPYYDVKFIPTGGVSLDNLEQYLMQPNVISVGGSFLAPSMLIQAQAWDEIEARCKKALEIVDKLKEEGM